MIFIKYDSAGIWHASDGTHDWSSLTYAGLKIKSGWRVYHAGGTGGDWEIVQACREGHTPVFSLVRAGHVLRCRIGKSQHYNCRALTGLRLHELERLPGLQFSYTGAEAGYVGLLQVAHALEGLTGEDPIGDRATSLGGVVSRALVARHGEWPVSRELESAHQAGRAECFRLGAAGRAWRSDRHSAYASAYLSAPERTELWRVRVKVPDSWHVSPWSAIGLSRQVWPTGEYDCWCWPYFGDRYPSVKLRVLERHTVDLTWLRRASSSVAEIYQRKLDAARAGDVVIERCVKLALANLYGKLAATGRGQRASFRPRPPRDGSPYYDFGGRYLTFYDFEYESKPNFGAAAWITEHARAQLWPAVSRSGVLYCHTDNLISVAKPDLDYGDGCGRWGDAEAGPAKIWGVGDYEFRDEIHRAGGSTRVRQTLRSKSSGPELPRHRKSWYEGRCEIGDGQTRPWTISEARKKWGTDD